VDFRKQSFLKDGVVYPPTQSTIIIEMVHLLALKTRPAGFHEQWSGSAMFAE
jgi:hypothetical protein